MKHHYVNIIKAVVVFLNPADSVLIRPQGVDVITEHWWPRHLTSQDNEGYDVSGGENVNFNSFGPWDMRCNLESIIF